MPVAERNLSPKGRAYGEAQKAAEFVQQTGGSPQAPVLPEVDVPMFPQQDLVEAVLTPTDRPDEPVTQGLTGYQEQQREDIRAWLPALRGLASRSDAPAFVKELAIQAGAFLEG